MPTYEYRREDGTTFEITQSIKDDALTHCPTTGQPVKRVIAGGTGLIFKGSGFYLTDYARKSGSPPAESASGSSDSGGADKGGAGEKSGGDGSKPPSKSTSKSDGSNSGGKSAD